MKNKSTELRQFEYKLQGCRRRTFGSDCIWITGEAESSYLMSGSSTELIETVSISRSYAKEEYARIYGIVAANQTNGRYVWIYLYCAHHLWKCHNIAWAFKIIDKVKAYESMVAVHKKLQQRETKSRKLLNS